MPTSAARDRRAPARRTATVEGTRRCSQLLGSDARVRLGRVLRRLRRRHRRISWGRPRSGPCGPGPVYLYIYVDELVRCAAELADTAACPMPPTTVPLGPLLPPALNFEATAADAVAAVAFDVAVGLLGARTKDPLCFGGCLPSASLGNCPAGAAAARSLLEERAAVVGPPPLDMPPASQCLGRVLGSTDTVRLDDSTSVRPFDAAKLNICHDGHQAVEMEPLLDPDTRRLAEDPARYILRPLDDVDETAEDFRPYIDPLLRDHVTVRGLVLKLAQLGLVVYQTFRYAIVAPFTVDKKGEKLRLVFDCRGPNQHCRNPPKTFLSTPYAISGLRIAAAEHRTGHGGDGGRPYRGHIVAVDLVDSFYLLRWTRLSGLFAFQEVFKARALDVTTAIGPDGGTIDVSGDTDLFACLSTLPMGWNWALHSCHCVCARAMVVASERLGLSAERARGQLLLDGRPCPVLGPGAPILCPYVDNCNAFLWDDSDAEQYVVHLTDVLNEFGLAHRIECAGLARFTTLGLDIDLERRLLINRPERTWRLRYAVVDLV